MVEIRKESVQMLHVKSRATSQVTFDGDYNVPRVMCLWRKSVSVMEKPISVEI